MKPIIACDAFLLDRIHQPIVDALYDRVGDCVVIARFCVLGYCVLTLAHQALFLLLLGEVEKVSFFGGALGLIGASYFYRRLGQRVGVTTGRNPMRDFMLPFRVLFTLLIACLIPLMVVSDTPAVVSLLQVVRDGIMASAVYFASCHNRPPARRRQMARDFAPSPL